MVQWLKTPCCQFRGPGFDPWTGNEIPHTANKSLHAETKTWHCQINQYLKKKNATIVGDLKSFPKYEQVELKHAKLGNYIGILNKINFIWYVCIYICIYIHI